MADPGRRGVAGSSGQGEALLFVGGPLAVAAGVLVGVALAAATGSLWVGLAAVAGGLLQIPLSIWLLETRANRAASTPEAGRRPIATSVVVLLVLSVVAALMTGLVTAAGYGWVVAAAFIVALAGLLILSFFD